MEWPDVISLPAQYWHVLRYAAANQPGEGTFWVSEVGFYVPVRQTTSDAWVQELAMHRWPRMHPSLLPFAGDGAGNRFCFYIRGDEEPSVNAIVYWSHQTYRAVPVSTDFVGFLDWMLVLGHWLARSLDVAPMDLYHLREVVLPFAREFRPDLEPLLPRLYGQYPSAHRQIVSVAPQSPASQLVVAMARMEDGHVEEARSRIQRAQLDFPEFAAAYAAEIQVAGDTMSKDESLHLLLRILRVPLLFNGDPQLASFNELPVLDTAWLFDELLGNPEFEDADVPNALYELVLGEVWWDAEPWLAASVECANGGDLELALVLALNASTLPMEEDIAEAWHSLMVEFFDALKWPWHLAAARSDLARHRSGVGVRK
jgi:hypothetical protein